MKYDVRHLIRDELKLKFGKDFCVTVEFAYERLPSLCFICGYFGHTEKFCTKLFEFEPGKAVRRFPPSLRASSRGTVKNVGDRWLRPMVFSSDSSESHRVQAEDGNSDNQGGDKAPVFQNPNSNGKETVKKGGQTHIYCNPLAVNHNANQSDPTLNEMNTESVDELVVGETKRKKMGLDQSNGGAQNFVSTSNKHAS